MAVSRLATRSPPVESTRLQSTAAGEGSSGESRPAGRNSSEVHHCQQFVVCLTLVLPNGGVPGITWPAIFGTPLVATPCICIGILLTSPQATHNSAGVARASDRSIHRRGSWEKRAQGCAGMGNVHTNTTCFQVNGDESNSGCVPCARSPNGPQCCSGPCPTSRVFGSGNERCGNGGVGPAS